MTILYGFTRDTGFAMVDTDARAYLYGYPTSDMHREARSRGARHTAEKWRARLDSQAGFVRRLAAHSPNARPEQIEGSYQHVYEQMVAPQTLGSAS